MLPNAACGLPKGNQDKGAITSPKKNEKKKTEQWQQGHDWLSLRSRAHVRGPVRCVAATYTAKEAGAKSRSSIHTGVKEEDEPKLKNGSGGSRGQTIARPSAEGGGTEVGHPGP